MILSRRERALALIVIGIIPVEVAWVGFLAIRHNQPLLPLAAAFDAALLAGGVLWLISRRQPLGIPPARWLRLSAIALAVAGLASRALGFRVASMAVAELLIVGVTVRYGLLPKPVANALKMELSIFGAALRALLRRPLPKDDRFLPANRNQLVVMVFVLTLFEAPALHLVLHGAAAHTILTVLHLYGLVWVLGDARLVSESGHRLGPDALALHLGLRLRGTIPYSQIREVVRDGSTVTLRLSTRARLEGYFGIRRTLDMVKLQLDEPDRFADQLMAAIDSSAHRIDPVSPR